MPGTIIFMPVGAKPSRNTRSIDRENVWTLPQRSSKIVSKHDVIVFFHGDVVRSIARPMSIHRISEKQYDKLWTVPEDDGVLKHRKNLRIIKFKKVTPYTGCITKKMLMEECGYKRVIGTIVARNHERKLKSITRYLKRRIADYN